MKKIKTKHKTINTSVGIVIIVLSMCLLELLIYGFYSFIYTKSDIGNDNNDKIDNVITHDSITNAKVNKIYNMVKMENNFLGIGPSYYVDNYSLNLSKKIDITLLQNSLVKSDLSKDQINYIKNTYESNNISLKYYISLNEFNILFQLVFNDVVTSDNLKELNKDHYGYCPIYIYDEVVNGFIINVNCNNNSNFKYISKVYKYTENDEQAEIEVAIALADISNSNEICDIYYGDNMIAYKNININSFEFDDDNIEDFIHIKYTFNKNGNDDYYLANIKKIK